MPITLLDGLLLVVMLASAMLAMVRGFSREVLSITSWVAAAAAVFFLLPTARDFALGYIESEEIALITAILVLFFGTLVIVSFIAIRLADLILDSRVGALDRTLGFVFGAARGALLVATGVLIVNLFIAADNQPRWVAEARAKPLIDQLGARIGEALPDDPDFDFLGRLAGRDDPVAAPTGQAGPGGQIDDADGQDLNRLIETQTSQ